ncbi:MAG: permease [Acidimicrobiales bacterium]
MIAATTVLVWCGRGFKETLAMVWMTFWPLVLGFTLAGVVQGMVPRTSLRRQLGVDSLRSHSTASLLGALSSSCSYAASAMSRALFSRGSSWTNALIFMVASTNLVIELAVVLLVLLGWPFVIAQVVGGVVMIFLLVALVPLTFRHARVERLSQRIAQEDSKTETAPATNLRDRFSISARYTTGDLTMVRKELVIGFVVAGFISVHVPNSWWSHIFVHGHGVWTVLENVIVAPLVSVVAFVCSVGNVPLAAALWGHGVAFGGVIAFLFADLVTFPLLVIYRRYYGLANAWRLFIVLWASASCAGLAIDGLFRLAHAIPNHRNLRILAGQFPLGATLVLNVVALVVLLALWRLARRDVAGHAAIDPVCGMSVERASAPAHLAHGAETVYFCSLGCRDKFLARGQRGQAESPGHTDPVCGMTVGDGALTGIGSDGLTYYFCGEGCRDSFLHEALPGTHPHERTE